MQLPEGAEGRVFHIRQKERYQQRQGQRNDIEATTTGSLQLPHYLGRQRPTLRYVKHPASFHTEHENTRKVEKNMNGGHKSATTAAEHSPVQKRKLTFASQQSVLPLNETVWDMDDDDEDDHDMNDVTNSGEKLVVEENQEDEEDDGGDRSEAGDSQSLQPVVNTRSALPMVDTTYTMMDNVLPLTSTVTTTRGSVMDLLTLEREPDMLRSDIQDVVDISLSLRAFNDSDCDDSTIDGDTGGDMLTDDDISEIIECREGHEEDLSLFNSPEETSELEDVARDWDYYIPGVEWSPSHMCTVTKYKQKTKENENVKSTTTEINYKIDPDEYRFSLPSKDKYLINSESPSDEDLNSSINTVQNKYGDYNISIEMDESVITINPAKPGNSGTPAGASVWSSSMWKSATGRLRKILQQFMDFVGPNEGNKDLAVIRAARAALHNDDNVTQNIMASSSKDLMVENEAFTDSGYLEDYDITTTSSNKNVFSNTNTICHYSRRFACSVHFVCEPSDGKSTLCSRCMREFKSSYSESNIQAIGQSVPLFKGQRVGSTNSQVKNWHRENKYKTRKISQRVSDKIDNMPITNSQDFTKNLETPLIETLLKGTISDMGILFPTSDGSDKYCFEHLNPAVSEPSLLDNEYMVKKALFTESNEQDDISLNMKHINVSSLISPHINKHLYCLTFDNSEDAVSIGSQSITNKYLHENKSDKDLPIKKYSSDLSNNSTEVDELSWEEMTTVT